MAAGTALTRLSALVIVGSLAACDNVTWGGASISLEPPPDLTSDSVIAAASVAEPPSVQLPEGPVLFVGERSGDQVRIVPFAEISGDSLAALPAGDPAFDDASAEAWFEQGSEFVLFAEGVRVGSTRIQSVTRDDQSCTARPAGSGPLELVPTATGAQPFLALRRRDGGDVPYEPYAALEHVRAQRVASLTFTGEVIQETGAQWSGDVLSSRRDVQAFQLNREGDLGFAATFQYRDQLGVRDADPAASSIFVVGVETNGGYQRAFDLYQSAGDSGRAVPVLQQYFDWNRDGTADLILDIQGTDTIRRGALWSRAGSWAALFVESCPTPLTEGG